MTARIAYGQMSWLVEAEDHVPFDIAEHAKLAALAKLDTWKVLTAPDGAEWAGETSVTVRGPFEQALEDDEGVPTGEVIHWKVAVAERPFFINPVAREKIEALRAKARSQMAATRDLLDGGVQL